MQGISNLRRERHNECFIFIFKLFLCELHDLLERQRSYATSTSFYSITTWNMPMNKPREHIYGVNCADSPAFHPRSQVSAPTSKPQNFAEHPRVPTLTRDATFYQTYMGIGLKATPNCKIHPAFS